MFYTVLSAQWNLFAVGSQGTDGSSEICHVEEIAAQPLELVTSSQQRALQRKPACDIDVSQRMIVYRHTRFTYHAETRTYRLLNSEAHTQQVDALTGLSGAASSDMLQLFGRNVIDIPIPPWYILLIREVCECLYVK